MIVQNLSSYYEVILVIAEKKFNHPNGKPININKITAITIYVALRFQPPTLKQEAQEKGLEGMR